MATIFCTATSLDGYLADDQESLSWLFATKAGSPPVDYPDDSGAASGADTGPDSGADLPRLHFSRFFAGVGAIVNAGR